MKNALKNCLKAGVVASVAAGVAVAQPQSAEAASFRFLPPGSQLDADGARDLALTVGQNQALQVVLDVFAGDLQAGETINKVEFNFGWDPTEVGVTSFNQVGPGSVSFANPSNVVLTGLNLTGSGASTTLLGTFNFTALAGLVNDNTGLGNDLRIVSGALSGVNVDGLFAGSPRGIDVQPVPTPALLPGLAAMGATLLRKRKKAEAAA